jgi:hypothetical protein
MKIGLISDTHLQAGRLPQEVEAAFRGVAMILHAGDLVTLTMLRQLARIAPVTAVQGNMDGPDVQHELPLKTVVEADGRRIGLIHGHHVPHANQVLPPPIDFAAMHAYLWSEFREARVDCIVYGHTHQSHAEVYRGVLIVNPGSATRGSNGRRTAALLAIDMHAVSVEIVDLAHANHPEVVHMAAHKG